MTPLEKMLQIIMLYGPGTSLEHWDACNRSGADPQHCAQAFVEEEQFVCSVICPPQLCEIESHPACFNGALCLLAGKQADAHAHWNMRKKREYQQRILQLMKYGACQ